MTDAPINNYEVTGYHYSGFHGMAYFQRRTTTTLANTAITAVTPIFDVRPCSHVTINTKVNTGHVDLFLRVILDEQFNADATWLTHSRRLQFAEDTVFENAIRLDTHKLGISYLRLDAQKGVSDTVIVDTWYRGLTDHVGNSAYLTGGADA